MTPLTTYGASRTRFGESTVITVGSTWTSSSYLDGLGLLSPGTSRPGMVPSRALIAHLRIRITNPVMMPNISSSLSSVY